MLLTKGIILGPFFSDDADKISESTGYAYRVMPV